MFSLVLMNCTLINLSSSWSCVTHHHLVPMCRVLLKLVLFSVMKMAPTLSSHTLTGVFTGIPRNSRICATKGTSLTASAQAQNSASLLDGDTTFWLLDLHAMGTPLKKMMWQPTDFRSFGSPAQLESEHTSSVHKPSGPIFGLIFNPSNLVPKTNLTQRSNSLCAASVAFPSTLESSFTADIRSGLECLIRNINCPTAVRNLLCKSSSIISDSSLALSSSNPGFPGAVQFCTLATSFPKVFSIFFTMCG